MFDMTEDTAPTVNSSVFLLKRWKKHTIYSKNKLPSSIKLQSETQYSTCSVYLYDYVAVSKKYFYELVYENQTIDSTPGPIGSEYGNTNLWVHLPNTFKNSPNATTNNYTLTGNFNGIRMVYGDPVILNDKDEYFELVAGYPRNHFEHKRSFFSLYQTPYYNNTNIDAPSGIFRKNRQTDKTTIGADGLTDGSLPVQSNKISNVNLIQTENTINL